MTAVRTKFEAGYYAVTTSSQKMIILDRFKKITVASVDNFKPLIDAMGVAPEKDIDIEHLNNASILYAMAAKRQIELGLFADGDKAVIEYCRSQISDDVNPEDVELLLQELTTSWQYIAKHPLLAKYVQLGEYLKSDGIGCQFSPLGAFELFVHDYFTGCVRAFIKSGTSELTLLKEWTNLIFSSLHGMGFCHNRFLKTEFFLTKVKQVLVETGPHRAQVEAFTLRTKHEHDTFKSMWFVDIRDWAKYELEDIEKQEGAGVALSEMLESKPYTINNEDLKFQLTELQKQLELPLNVVNPFMKTSDLCMVSQDVVTQNKLIKEVISYAIVTYAFEYGITLYPQQVTLPEPSYLLAGKGDAAEAELVKLMLNEDESVKFLPFELYAIARNARSEVLKEIVNQVVKNRARFEAIFSLSNAFGALSVSSISSLAVANATGIRGAPVTHQYRRLEGVLVGKQPGGGLFMFQNVQSPDQPKQVNEGSNEAEGQPKENPKDALHEAFNLQKPGSCVII